VLGVDRRPGRPDLADNKSASFGSDFVRPTADLQQANGT
jgi:hypothetical protein